MVILDIGVAGNSIAVRPSGTEPKAKFYLLGFTPAEQLADLDEAKAAMCQQLDRLEKDIRAFCESV